MIEEFDERQLADKESFAPQKLTDYSFLEWGIWLVRLSLLLLLFVTIPCTIFMGILFVLFGMQEHLLNVFLFSVACLLFFPFVLFLLSKIDTSDK